MKCFMRIASVLFALLVMVCGVARADVDVTVQNGDKVQGSISAPGGADVYRITCPAGAALKVKAKGKKGMRPDVSIEAPGDRRAGPKKGGTTLTLDPLPASGAYVVTVTGEAGSQGDYALSISFKTDKKVTRPVTLGVDETAVPFSVEAGTTLRVTAKAEKGSPVVPRILRIAGPSGFALALSGPVKTASDALGKTVLPHDGDYVLFVDDSSGTGGAAAVTIKLKQRKPAKRKIDLRDRTIGNSSGERLVVSEVVGTGGGTVGVALPGDGGPESLIAGANVQVPAGALTSPTPIIVATSSDVKPKGKDGGAGPSVFFGPEGLRFGVDVNVTVPFDVAQFAGDFSDLRVYTRDARGKVTLVPQPYDVDVESGTCTFPSSHFSSFRAARAGAGGGGGNAKFLGVWRQVTLLDPDQRVYLVLTTGSGAEIVATSTVSTFCTRSPLFPVLTPFDLVFEIVNGRLRFKDSQEQTPEFVPASESEIPTNCETL